MSTIKVNTVTKRTGSTLTLGESGTTVTLACGATQTGFGRTGTVDWCTTAKTSPFTAVSGDGFFVNTTSGAVTVTLPASPSAGDIVAFADYASTWQTNALTVCRNGSKINGTCQNVDLNVEGQSVTLVYVDGTRGWKNVVDSTSNVTGAPNFICATGGTILTCGDFKTHVFTSDGTFTINTAPTPANNSMDYVVIAGGGGGAGGGSTGGGGAGGFRLSNCVGSIPAPTMSPLVAACGAITGSIQSYPVTVGGGGAGGPTSAPVKATSGANSIFSTITSTGGGHGSGSEAPSPPSTGGPGGSGGGGGFPSPGQPNTGPNSPTSPLRASGGTGNSPPVSPSQGNNGGKGFHRGAVASGGGGGGAAGAVGGDAVDGYPSGPNSSGGAGGTGSFIADAFLGPTAPSYGEAGPVSSTRYFAGGGGGSGGQPGYSPAPEINKAGIGGGGAGATSPSFPYQPDRQAGNGTANTGGGGGGGGSCSTPNPGGTGGSGVVIIRYKFQ